MVLDLLDKKDKRGNKVMDYLVVLVISVLAVAIRLPFLSAKFPDYIVCLKPWVDQFKEYGGLAGLGHEIGNYTPAYMHFLMIFSYFDIEPVYLIKGLGILMDFFLAGAGACLIAYGGTRKQHIAMYAILLMVPTVLTNSGVWGQCDNFYATFILFALFFSLKDISYTIGKGKKWQITFKTEDMVIIFTGLAFAFKLQTIFILPVLAVLFLKKRWRLWSLLWIPVVYGITIFPSWLAGRGLKDLLTIYFRQTGDFSEYTLYYPNVYTLWQNETFAPQFAVMSMIFCGMGLVVTVYVLYGRNFTITPRFLCLFTTFSVLFIANFLPHMHERYGYVADILSVSLLLHDRKKTLIPVVLILISLMTYARHLLWFDYGNVLAVAALARMGIILYLGKLLLEETEEKIVPYVQ